jgi:hypothetical protein
MPAALTDAQLEQVIAILGVADSTEQQREAQVASLLGDKLLARRAIDWIAEAFGIALIGHMGKIGLPQQFSASDLSGQWIKFPMSAEPIYAQAGRRALDMFHNGSRETFSAIAQRSGLVATVNNALKANPGQSLDGANFTGLAMIGVPAETYLQDKPGSRPFWRKLFG